MLIGEGNLRTAIAFLQLMGVEVEDCTHSVFIGIVEGRKVEDCNGCAATSEGREIEDCSVCVSSIEWRHRYFLWLREVKVLIQRGRVRNAVAF